MVSICYGLVQFAEMILGIWTFGKMYPEKRKHSICLKTILILTFVAWGMVVVWNTWIFFVSNVFVILNSFILAILIFAYWRTFFSLALLWELFYNITFELSKMLFLILEGVIEQKTQYEANLGVRNYKETIWCFVIFIIAVTIVQVKKDILQLMKTMLYRYKKVQCFLCCIGWLMLTYSMYLGMQGFSTSVLVLHSIFIICVVMAIFYLMLDTLYEKVKIERYMLDAFQGALEKQNQELQIIYNQNNKKMHDVKHIMLYLENCLEQGKAEEAQKQIFQYTNELRGMERKVWTGFSFLDFILNYKKAEMDKNEISFKLDVDLYSIPLEEAELGIVLGNLFDNAIEAANQCESQKRNIYLKIGNMNQMFLLCMKNSSIREPYLKKGRFMTTKEDSYAHGLGVESVKRIVEDQGGSIWFQYDEEHFEVTILI